MEKERRIFIFSNKTEISNTIEKKLRQKLSKTGMSIYSELDNSIDLIICIGGDGTLLNLLHEKSFPKMPIVGINTGHLGFFQEVLPDKLDDFIYNISHNEYTVNPYSVVKATIHTINGTHELRALNEFALKPIHNSPIHIDISINDSFIERYSGDGICVATPAGSTAYNYSLGGSIVDPRLNLLQVTPMAPMNTTAYRSLTSSILLPANDKLIVKPSVDNDHSISLIYDGFSKIYKDVNAVTFSLSRRKVNLVSFKETTFWDKVKDKFL